jgi:hypothetical protein
MDEFKDIDDNEIDNLVEHDNSEFANLLKRNEELTNELLQAAVSNDDSQDEVKIKARAFALKHLPDALTTIADLAQNADKDSTRLSAARTIWAIASGTSAKDGSDPIESLFNKLSADGLKNKS